MRNGFYKNIPEFPRPSRNANRPDALKGKNLHEQNNKLPSKLRETPDRRTKEALPDQSEMMRSIVSAVRKTNPPKSALKNSDSFINWASGLEGIRAITKKFPKFPMGILLVILFVSQGVRKVDAQDEDRYPKEIAEVTDINKLNLFWGYAHNADKLQEVLCHEPFLKAFSTDPNNPDTCSVPRDAALVRFMENAPEDANKEAMIKYILEFNGHNPEEVMKKTEENDTNATNRLKAAKTLEKALKKFKVLWKNIPDIDLNLDPCTTKICELVDEVFPITETGPEMDIAWYRKEEDEEEKDKADKDKKRRLTPFDIRAGLGKIKYDGTKLPGRVGKGREYNLKFHHQASEINPDGKLEFKEQRAKQLAILNTILGVEHWMQTNPDTLLNFLKEEIRHSTPAFTETDFEKYGLGEETIKQIKEAKEELADISFQHDKTAAKLKREGNMKKTNKSLISNLRNKLAELKTERTSKQAAYETLITPSKERILSYTVGSLETRLENTNAENFSPTTKLLFADGMHINSLYHSTVITNEMLAAIDRGDFTPGEIEEPENAAQRTKRLLEFGLSASFGKETKVGALARINLQVGSWIGNLLKDQREANFNLKPSLWDRFSIRFGGGFIGSDPILTAGAQYDLIEKGRSALNLQADYYTETIGGEEGLFAAGIHGSTPLTDRLGIFSSAEVWQGEHFSAVPGVGISYNFTDSSGVAGGLKTRFTPGEETEFIGMGGIMFSFDRGKHTGSLNKAKTTENPYEELHSLIKEEAESIPANKKDSYIKAKYALIMDHLNKEHAIQDAATEGHKLENIGIFLGNETIVNEKAFFPIQFVRPNGTIIYTNAQVDLNSLHNERAKAEHQKTRVERENKEISIKSPDLQFTANGTLTVKTDNEEFREKIEELIAKADKNLNEELKARFAAMGLDVSYIEDPTNPNFGKIRVKTNNMQPRNAQMLIDFLHTSDADSDIYVIHDPNDETVKYINANPDKGFTFTRITPLNGRELIIVHEPDKIPNLEEIYKEVASKLAIDSKTGITEIQTGFGSGLNRFIDSSEVIPHTKSFEYGETQRLLKESLGIFKKITPQESNVSIETIKTQADKFEEKHFNAELLHYFRLNSTIPLLQKQNIKSKIDYPAITDRLNEIAKLDSEFTTPLSPKLIQELFYRLHLKSYMDSYANKFKIIALQKNKKLANKLTSEYKNHPESIKYNKQWYQIKEAQQEFLNKHPEMETEVQDLRIKSLIETLSNKNSFFFRATKELFEEETGDANSAEAITEYLFNKIITQLQQINAGHFEMIKSEIPYGAIFGNIVGLEDINGLRFYPYFARTEGGTNIRNTLVQTNLQANEDNDLEDVAAEAIINILSYIPGFVENVTEDFAKETIFSHLGLKFIFHSPVVFEPKTADNLLELFNQVVENKIELTHEHVNAIKTFNQFLHIIRDHQLNGKQSIDLKRIKTENPEFATKLNNSFELTIALTTDVNFTIYAMCDNPSPNLKEDGESSLKYTTPPSSRAMVFSSPQEAIKTVIKQMRNILTPSFWITPAPGGAGEAANPDFKDHSDTDVTPGDQK